MVKMVVHHAKFLLLGLALVLIGSGCSTQAGEAPSTLVPIASTKVTAVKIASPIPTQSQVNLPSATATEATEAVVTPTLMAMATPKPSAAAAGTLYRDDFTSPDTGWANGIKYDNYFVGYHEPSSYHVDVHVPYDRAIAVVPKQSFDDVTAETQVFVLPEATAPNGDFRYGLVFRRSGNQYYAFTISPRTKTWTVLKSSPTGLQDLAHGSSDAIGLKEDTLRLDAAGSRFFFRINDQPITQVSDADYAKGDLGFYVETFDSPRAHIHFDTLTVRQVESPDLLYRDDFTSPDTGWANGIKYDNYFVGYHEPSSYHVDVHVPYDRAIAVVPKQSFDDVIAETQVFVLPEATAPNGDFRYGLVFRRSGNQYYAFTISPRTKTWTVLKSSPTGLQDLAHGSSDAIGLKEDTLRLDAAGSRFFFRINDQPITQVSDADYAKGDLGFYVETFDSPRAHIHFDTLTVRQVESPPPACMVVISALNFRNGPGVYHGWIRALLRGARMEPLARNPDGTWIKVRLEDTGQVGWLAGTSQYVTCDMPVNELQVEMQ